MGKRKPVLRPVTQIPGSIAAYAVAFLEHERQRKAFARSTIKAHTRRLGYFTAWAYAHRIISPFEITSPIIELFCQHLSRKGHSDRNRQDHLRTLVAFFTWLHEQGYTLENPSPPTGKENRPCD